MRIYLKEVGWLSLYFFLLIPPVLVHNVQSGLDPSWCLSINLALNKQLVFGQDYIFTYGPLGFLKTKLAVYNSKWIILIFELFVITSAVYILRYILKPKQYNLYQCIIALIAVLFLSIDSGEYVLIHSFIILQLIFLKDKNTLALYLALGFSILSFYIKVNYGIILIVLLSTTLLLAKIKRIITTKQFITAIVIHLALLILSSLLFKVNLIQYIKSSLFIIDSYNDAMAIYMPIDNPLVVYAVAVIILYLIGFLFSYREYLSSVISFYFYIINGLFLYLAFKNSFVRADIAHTFVFYLMAPVIFCSIYFAGSKSYKFFWAAATFSVISISFFMFSNRLFVNTRLEEMVYINNYWEDIFNTNSSYKNNLKDDSRQQTKISPWMITQIGQKSVDIIPWEISEVFYNKLNYIPRPIPQSYSAYNGYLDKKNSEKYSSVSAPEYLVFDNISIDNRHPFWDESITKRTILANYYLMNADTSTKENLNFDEVFYLEKYPDIKSCVVNGYFKSGYEHYVLHGKKEGRIPNASQQYIYLLFQKRNNPLKPKVVRERNSTLEIGKEYKIDTTRNPQYLYADINYSFTGKLNRLLFQPPPINVILSCDDGTHERYSAIVPIMKTGVLINKKVVSRDESKLFFSAKGAQNKNIVSIKFEADYGFEKEISITIKEIVFDE